MSEESQTIEPPCKKQKIEEESTSQSEPSQNLGPIDDQIMVPLCEKKKNEDYQTSHPDVSDNLGSIEDEAIELPCRRKENKEDLTSRTGIRDQSEKLDHVDDFSKDVDMDGVDQAFLVSEGKYSNFVSPEELERLREFQVLDEVKSNDEDSNDEDSESSDGKSEGLPDEEIEKMLEEDLPEDFKGAPKPKEKPYITREKIVLEEKGVNHFEVLPLDWMVARHYSGMPIYMHRATRVCTLSKPYFLGKGNTRRHDIPISAIPCLAYRRALEEEKKQKEIDKQIDEQIKNGTWKQNVDKVNHDKNSVNNLNNDLGDKDKSNFKESSEKSVATVFKCPFSGKTANEKIDKDSIDVNSKCPFKRGFLTKDSEITKNMKNNDDSIIISEDKPKTAQDNIILNEDLEKEMKNASLKNITTNDDKNTDNFKSDTTYEAKTTKQTKSTSEIDSMEEVKYVISNTEATEKEVPLKQKPVMLSEGNTNNQLDSITDFAITEEPKDTIINTELNKEPLNMQLIMLSGGNTTNRLIDFDFTEVAKDTNSNTEENNSELPINVSNTTHLLKSTTHSATEEADKCTKDIPNNREINKEVENATSNTEAYNKEVPLNRQPVVLPGGLVMPPPRVETVSTSWKTQHLTPDEVNEYCKSLFKFKTVNIMHFQRWADRRKYTKARKTLQYPSLPEGTKLITIPAQPSSGQENGGKSSKRDWVMNMNGRSYLSVFHEYVRRALQKQPVYEFKQLENASTPYQATVYIGGMQYGVGRGSSKRAAKSAAARASIHILIPEMRHELDDKPEGGDDAEPDFSFFDYVGIEDPRITEFCAATCEPSPHAILRTCLLRNFGAGDRHIQTEMKKLEYQKIELTMKVGKHSATVVCKNKKTAKQRASQAILQALHPHVRSWGSLLRLYGSRSVKSCKEKKLEEQQITLLQDAAKHNEPNYAVLEKLRNEMIKLRERDEAVVPIGTLLVKDDLPTHSGSNLNNVDL